MKFLKGLAMTIIHFVFLYFILIVFGFFLENVGTNYWLFLSIVTMVYCVVIFATQRQIIKKLNLSVRLYHLSATVLPCVLSICCFFLVKYLISIRFFYEENYFSNFLAGLKEYYIALTMQIVLACNFLLQILVWMAAKILKRIKNCSHK